MFVRTLRLAACSLRRRPGFSALAIVTIALGAGANAAVSAVGYGILVKPLPFARPDRLVAVWPGRFMSQVDLRYLRDHADAVSDVAAIAPGWTFSLTGSGEASKITVDRVSGNLFTVLGASPLIGRLIRPEEEQPGAPHVLAISTRYWRARFGGDPAVVGRIVKLDDVPHEIVAVMPPSFELLSTRTDAWTPLPADRAAFYDRLNFSLLIGRLRDGVPLEQADRQFKELMPAMRRDLQYAATFGRDARLEDLRTATVGDMRTSLIVLGAAVAFMLLIAGANLGTLLVASGTGRAREFAVHAAVGASRTSIVGMQLAEGMLLALAGAIGGLAAARAAMPLIVRLLPGDTPRSGEVTIDAAVALAVIVAALAVGLIFAVAPSLSSTRRSFATLLRAGASTESPAARRTRGTLVAVQIALALVLTIGAGLMVQTLWRLQHVDAGIDVDRILTLRLQPSSARYKAPDALLAYYDEVLARVGALGGVRAVGAIQHLPFSGIGWIDAFDIEGRPPVGEPRPTADYKIVLGDYFTAVGQPVRAGRTFTNADRQSPAIVVNEAFARRYFGSITAAVGGRMRTGRNAAGEWRTIIGVVGDVHTRTLDRPVSPEFYTIASGSGIPALMIAVHTSADPLSLAGSVREAIAGIDRGVPIADVQTMRAMVGTTLARPALLLNLLAAFAAAGLMLSAIGIYGIVTFAVMRRRRELGIRVALGASRGGIVQLVVRESLAYAVGGLAAGIVLARLTTRLMNSMLFGVSPVDGVTFGVTAVAVAAVVMLASYAPARRAAAVDPADSLRSI